MKPYVRQWPTVVAYGFNRPGAFGEFFFFGLELMKAERTLLDQRPRLARRRSTP